VTAAAADLSRLVRNLRRNAERATKHGSGTADPEAVHDLRVATRRLGSALRLWRPVLEKETRAPVERSLRRLRRRFGEARDLEVQIEILTPKLPVLPPEVRATAAAWVGRLAASYRERLERALQALDSEETRWLLADLGQLPRHLVARLGTGRGLRSIVQHRIARDHERAVEALRIAIARPGAENAKLAHAARIRVKKWRYSLERAGAIFGTKPRDLEALRDLQEALGETHDRDVLLALLAGEDRSDFAPLGLEFARERVFAMARAAGVIRALRPFRPGSPPLREASGRRRSSPRSVTIRTGPPIRRASASARRRAAHSSS